MVERNNRQKIKKSSNDLESVLGDVSDGVGRVVRGVGRAVEGTFDALEDLVTKVTSGQITAYDDVGLTSSGMHTNRNLYTAAVHLDGRFGYQVGDVFRVTNRHGKQIYVLANDKGGMPNASAGLDLYDGKTTKALGMQLSGEGLSDCYGVKVERIGNIGNIRYQNHNKAKETLQLLADINEGRKPASALKESGLLSGGPPPKGADIKRNEQIERNFTFLGMDKAAERTAYLAEMQIDPKDKNAVFSQLKTDVAAIQQKLNAAGFQVGRADGIAGNRTLAGAKNAEKAIGNEAAQQATALRLAHDQDFNAPDTTPAANVNDRFLEAIRRHLKGAER